MISKIMGKQFLIVSDSSITNKELKESLFPTVFICAFAKNLRFVTDSHSVECHTPNAIVSKFL